MERDRIRLDRNVHFCIRTKLSFARTSIGLIDIPIYDITSCHDVDHAESSNISLLVIILSLIVDDVEEAELIDTLGGRDDAEPITELLLLEELLGAVVERLASAIKMSKVSPGRKGAS